MQMEMRKDAHVGVCETWTKACSKDDVTVQCTHVVKNSFKDLFGSVAWQASK